MPSLVEIGFAVLEKKMKMSKVYDNDEDNGQIVIKKAHLIIRLRRAKKNTKFHKSLNKPGQMVSEHCCISYAFPEQIFPPFEGAGLSHMRARVFEPSPQVTEHGDQRIQSDQ